MKSNKTLAIAMAGAVFLNSSNLWALDRTAGIGESQATAAREQLQTLRAQLSDLDAALAATNEAIIKRDKQGSILGGAAIAGAAVGLGFTAMAKFTVGRGEYSLMTMMASAVVAGLASGGSSALGGAGLLMKDDVDTKVVDQQLMALELQVKNAKNEKLDQATLAVLTQFENSVISLRSNLAEYSEKTTAIEKNKMRASLAQFVGTSLFFLSATSVVNKASVANIAPIVMIAGNIGQIVTRLSDDQAEEVVNEIQKLREVITTTSMAIK